MNRNVLTLCFLQWFCIIISMIIFVKYILNLPSGHMIITRNLNSGITNNEDDEYYVNSETCKVHRVNLFSDELLRYYVPFKRLSCAYDDDLVTSKFHAKTGRYILYLKEHASCSYREIIRSGFGFNADKKAKLSEIKVDFRNSYIVPLHIEGMLVKCCDRNGNRQMTAFAFVQTQNESIYNADKQPTMHPDKPSIIMLGIDSLSRINLQRSMPKLYEYLKQPGWFELQGYNKVGDNTFPNLLAVLTGHSPKAAERYYCDYRTVGCLNRLPFIWKDFQYAGYKTAYVEDNPKIGTFNSRLPGFEVKPVIFYPRPFFIAIQKHLTFIERFNRLYCIGRKHTLTYNFGYCHDFIERYIDRQPIFGLFWANQFGASDCESASAFDVDTLNHLKSFADIGLYDKSIVIFFSDHGARYGRMRALPEGFIDERSPALYIWLPEWFRQRYPQYAQALKDNRNRLTSNYDLHLTLKQILNIGGYSGTTTTQKLPECPFCQSLFAPVPFNRTCAEAGIRNHYCTCHPSTPVPHTDVFHIMSLVMDAMNLYLASHRMNDICIILTLNRLKEAHRIWMLNTDDHNVLTYRLKYIVDQNDAEFETTVQYRKKSDEIDLDVETISRLNAHSPDAVCVTDKILKKYCICRTQLKPSRTRASRDPSILKANRFESFYE